MIGAGTIINPILKIVTTVAVLAAAYFFIVRPVLDTTEEIVDKAGDQFQISTGPGGSSFGGGSFGGGNFDLEAARSSAESYATSLQGGWPEAAREIKECMRDAGRDAKAMEGCRQLGLTLAHTIQSDYNFANSYADSLDAQGRSDDADRVRACVEKAGFRVGPMEHCRSLADKLLFG